MIDTYALIDLTDFSSALDGEHVYADVSMCIGGSHMGSSQVTYELNSKQAAALNKKDGNEEGMMMKAGFDSPRFNGEDHAIEHAIKLINAKWPFVKFAFIGRCLSNPSKCVMCDDIIIQGNLNNIYNQYEECYATSNDPWSAGLGDEVDNLNDEWDNLIKSIE